MKHLALLVMLAVSGCALYWDDERLIYTFAKDYDLKALTSTSNKFKGKATLGMPPNIEVETK